MLSARLHIGVKRHGALKNSVVIVTHDNVTLVNNEKIMQSDGANEVVFKINEYVTE